MSDVSPNAWSTDSGAQVEVTPLDPPARRMMFRTLVAVLALEPLIIIGVLVMLGIQWEIIIALLAALVVIIALVCWLLVTVMWKPLARRYPARPFCPGAVSQSWQTFAFGPLMRMNNCLTIVADEQHLHLRPFTPMRWLGAGWVSLPLDRITDVQRGVFGQMTANLDGRTIAGPSWCLELAAGTLDDPGAENPE